MKRVLVVGGHVPKWAQAAFDVEHFTSEAGTGKFEPAKPPDAIVVNVDFVSHQHSGLAHEHGAAHKVPVLHARTGWSSAIEEAARTGVDWFVQAVHAAGRHMAKEQQKEAEEVETFVESAWAQTVAHERGRSVAAEKRLAKERVRREELEGTLRRLRSGAEQRIVGEIRRRAAELREAAARRDAEVQLRVGRLATAAREAIRVAQEAQEKLQAALRVVDQAAVQASGDLSLIGGVDSADKPA